MAFESIPYSQEEQPQTPATPSEQPQEGQQGEAQPKPDEGTGSQPEAPKKPDLSYLIKREKEAFDINQKAKARQAELDRKYQEIEAKERRIQEFEQKLKRAKENPEELLGEAGLSYSDLTQYYMNDKKPTPDLQYKSLEEKFNKFLQDQEQSKTRAMEEEKTRLEQQKAAEYDRFKSQVTDFVKGNAEKYELTEKFKQSDLVRQTIEAHFQASGEVMTFDTAADLVEKHLEEQIDEAMKTKKLSGRYTRAEIRAMEAEAREEARSEAPVRTLSNNMGSSMTPRMESRPSSEESRVQRAMAAFQKYSQN